MSLAQIEIVANQIEAQRFGYMAISLTEYDTDNEPQIAAGSKVEIGGALFSAAAAESITGWGSIGNNNDVYIKLVVSGTTATAEFTTTAPTWSTSKQGWHGTGGAALHRYVAKLRKDGSGNYTDKGLLQGGPEVRNAAIGSDAVRTPQIRDAAVTGPKIPDNAITGEHFLKAGGGQAIGAGSTWEPSTEGVYTWVCAAALTTQVCYDGSTWLPAGDSAYAGSLIVGGVNLRSRLSNAGGATTLYWMRVG